MLRVLLLLLIAANCASAQVQPPDAEAALRRALEAVSIRDQGAFKLIASVRYSWLGRKYEGEYRLTWSNENRWSEEIRVGDYHEVRIGGRAVVQGEANPAGYRFIGDHLRRLIAFDTDIGLKPGESVKSRKSREKQQLECIGITRDKGAGREVCLNEAGLPASVARGQTLSDFHSFGTRKFPFLLKQESLSDVQGSVAEIKLTELTAVKEEDATVASADSKGGVRGCFAPSPVQVLQRVRPAYPALARQSRISGVVVVEAVIDENGKATKGIVLEGHPMLRDAVVDAVRRSTFKPADCDGTPVEGVIVFTSVFSMGG